MSCCFSFEKNFRIFLVGIYNNYTQSCASVLCNPVPGLICQSNQCVCPVDYYWNSSNSNDPKGYCGMSIPTNGMINLCISVPYASHTEKCNRTSECLANSSLICVNGTCQCPSIGKWYWTGSICSKKVL